MLALIHQSTCKNWKMLPLIAIATFRKKFWSVWTVCMTVWLRQALLPQVAKTASRSARKERTKTLPKFLGGSNSGAKCRKTHAMKLQLVLGFHLLVDLSTGLRRVLRRLVRMKRDCSLTGVICCFRRTLEKKPLFPQWKCQERANHRHKQIKVIENIC